MRQSLEKWQGDRGESHQEARNRRLEKGDNGEDEVVQQAQPQQVGGGRYNNQGTN